jgi:hypothetical protein
LPSITFVFFRLANSGSDRARRPPLLPLLAVPMRRRRATELRRRGQRNEAGDGEQQRSPGRESHLNLLVGSLSRPGTISVARAAMGHPAVSVR